ncbi:MAG: twin-arginine translocation signal domain-containing protein [Eggerthellaceae bacterium]
MTRRSFVQAATLAGAAAAIGVSMPNALVETEPAYADEPVETKVVKTSCHGCIQMCPVRAYIENGVVVKLEGDGCAREQELLVPEGPQSTTPCSHRRILHP